MTEVDSSSRFRKKDSSRFRYIFLNKYIYIYVDVYVYIYIYIYIYIYMCICMFVYIYIYDSSRFLRPTGESIPGVRIFSQRKWKYTGEMKNFTEKTVKNISSANLTPPWSLFRVKIQMRLYIRPISSAIYRVRTLLLLGHFFITSLILGWGRQWKSEQGTHPRCPLRHCKDTF